MGKEEDASGKSVSGEGQASTVTLRHRDTMKQVRVRVDELHGIVA